MPMRIDTTGTGCTEEARALLASLDDSTFVSLGVLFGADLCVLGGTGPEFAHDHGLAADSKR
jgi:hypothetical protein